MLKNMLSLMAVLFVSSASFAIEPPPSIDLGSYLGLWMEQARIPNSFQDNSRGRYGICTRTSATYGDLPGGKISVTNRCTRINSEDSSDSRLEIAHGVATVVPGSNHTKLKVNFTGVPLLRWLGIGNGDYWILAVGPKIKGQYEWALVGSPKRDFGWILARKTLETAVMDEILDYAESKGYVRTDFVDTRESGLN